MSKGKTNPIRRVLSLIMVFAMLLTLMPVTALAADGTTVYLKPNSNWLIDGARFAAYYWDDYGSNWASMSDVGGGLYAATIPAGYSNIIFCRMNPSTSTNDWSNKWNQTSDLTIPAGSNCYTVADGTWDSGGGTWSYIPAYYSVSYELTNLASSNTASTVQEKTEYTTTLTADEGYVLPETVSVTVGGSEVTGYSYEGGVLTIPAALVTGNIAITAEAVEEQKDQILYLKPNSNWMIDGARFAVYYWDDYGSNWASMSGPDADGYYSVIIPEGYTNIIFCRMNPGSSTNDWSNKWNQTSDLTIPAGSNCYTVADGTWDSGGGTWSYYAPSVEEPTEEPTESTEAPEVAVDYYLIGYINGANYGCEEDWENLGDYKFVDGKLTVTFAQDSYVFVKTGDNANWYLADAYCTDTTVTLKLNSAEKMFVPGGVELTFTLVENADGTLTLSYEEVPEEPAVDYYLVGYINGADYGIAGDSANLGDYKFADGKLTVTFTQDSYVLVKNGSNVMYMTEAYSTSSSATLTQSGSEKLFAPGNVELTFTLVENADGTLTLSYEADAGEVPEDAEYYLVGYINGADYGIAGDSANLGDYKFADGKLTVTFTQDSYVVVKNSSNMMYMSEAYCTDTTATLKVGAAEKMYVPGNVELTFSLTVNADGTLTLSYETAGGEEPAADYYLVGYINGADYGIGGDSASLGDYKFVDGKLTVAFTQDSYVVVKNSSNTMYMSEAYCTDTTVTLKVGASEKMFVPGGQELTFTLVENADGTLTLSYGAAEEIPEGYTTVTIHFLKTEGWGSTVNGYVWYDGGAVPGYEEYNTWPGKAISASAGHSGWYDLIVATENPTAFNFIFNDGGNQTADLYTGEITGDTELWVIGNSVMTTEPGEWTGDYDYTAYIHFQKPDTWGTGINAYLWDANGALPGYESYNAWPGAAIAADVINAGWYNVSVTMDENAGFNFILNDGTNQTADLSTGTLQVTTHIWVVNGQIQTTAPAGWVDPNLVVNVPGTFPGPSWDAASNPMTYDPELGLYVYTFEDVPAANYEFKIAINGSWTENYGAGGELNGGNIAVTVPETMDVIVYYNPNTHYAVTNVNYVFADITLSGTGIPEGTKMKDEGLTGIYSVKVPMEAGTYTDIKITYGGKTYFFAEIVVTEDKDVTFYMDPVTGIYYCDASNTPIDTAKIYFNSQDTTYKSAFGAIATGESCTFAIDTGADIASAVLVIKGMGSFPMTAEETEEGKRWTCSASVDSIGEYDYYFALSNGSTVAIYGDDDGYYGEGTVTDLVNVLPYDLVVYKSGYETPDWMKKAVIYQIFPDRFFDGDMSNNQAQTTARGDVQYEYVNNWYLWPENPEQEEMYPDQYPDQAYQGDGEWSNEIYGGDLQGIIEKVDYLKALGVNVIYLNPVFSSISNHRYDACDYTEIDPILGTMGDFEELVAVAEANDMQIILDGVFNHVSDDSVYFDRYYKFLGTSEKIGAYPYWAYVYDYMAENGASQADAEVAAKAYFSENYGITDYSYTEWFEVYNTTMAGAVDSIGLRAGKGVYSYDGWWGYDSMPIIYATNGSEYQTGNWAEEIIYNEDGTSVTQYWISKGNDGWRLDVANEVSDETWQKFRDSVKAMNDGEVVIIGEIWDDATKYLLGDMYDSVMNYMFRNAVTAFAMGTSSEQTMKELEKLRERYPEEAFYAMMNLVGSHDTSRILSYLDGIGDDRADKTPGGAYPTYETTSDLAKNRQFLVAFLQFTYPGAPTIYYGDELGMVGSDDPDDRRAMEWGKGNQTLVEWYANLAAIRAQYPALSTGAIQPIDLGDSNLLGYIRSEGDTELIVIGNNSSSDKTVKISVPKSESYVDLVTGQEFTDEVTIDGLRGVILVRKSQYVDVFVDTEKLAPAYDSDYTVPVEEREETAPAVEYTTQDGQQVELGDGLTFTVEDALVNTFVKVLVDGEEVEAQVTSGIAGTDTTGTTITLSAELIEELGLGEHTIEIVFEGGSASASFTVVEETEEPTEESTEATEETTESTEATEETTAPTTPEDDTPAVTGDSSQVILWTMLMLLSAAAVLAMLLQRKRIME